MSLSIVVVRGASEGAWAKQPWRTALGLAEGLAHRGATWLVTDAIAPPSPPAGVRIVRSRCARAVIETARPDRVFRFTGASEIARGRQLGFGAPTTAVVASPLLTVRDFARAGFEAQPPPAALLAGSAAPGWVLRRGWRRAGAERLWCLSRETAGRLRERGLNVDAVLEPAVDRVFSSERARGRCDDRREFLYVGPILASRGAFVALEAFEWAARAGYSGRLRYLARPDAGADGRRLAEAIARSPFRARIELIEQAASPRALARAMAAADATLLPFAYPISDAPLALIEAALAAKRLAALDAPGVREILSRVDGVIERSADRLAAALLERLDAPPARVDPERARRWTSWPAAVEQALDGEQRRAPWAMIALIGVDGVGKTALADRIAARLESQGSVRFWSRYRHFLVKPLLGLGRVTGHNRKLAFRGATLGEHRFRRPAALAWSALALFAIDGAIDLILRLRLRRPAGVVVADRCHFDMIVDWAAATGLERPALHWLVPLFARLLPKPLLVLEIDRPPRAIARDRPDALADPQFAARRRIARDLARALGAPTIRNDGALDEAEWRAMTIIGGRP